MKKNTRFLTAQEEFWAGEFGDEYIGRNQGQAMLESNLRLFSDALKNTQNISSCLEFGANIGVNLEAIKALNPAIKLKGVEINADAFKQLKMLIGDQAHLGSILDYDSKEKVDLTFTKTVLIHINPESLSAVYEKLYQVSSRYILICEYYNTTPVSIDYRGHSDRLFKRDFAGEMLDYYTDLKLIDNGFIYHRDYPMLDDMNWFLLEKSNR